MKDISVKGVWLVDSQRTTYTGTPMSANLSDYERFDNKITSNFMYLVIL